VKSLLEKSGMAYFVGDKSSSKTEGGGIFEEVEIIIGQTKEILDKILEIESRMLTAQQTENGNYDEEKNKQDQADFGLALGYPSTAVEAFINEAEPLDENFLPQEVKQSDAYLFCQYQLSENNWQEELKTAQEWADFIKKTSFNIFEQYRKEKLT
jgi:hypothetical protein